MKFAINRLNMTNPEDFASSAAEAERLGWYMGLIPVNPLKVILSKDSRLNYLESCAINLVRRFAG